MKFLAVFLFSFLLALPAAAQDRASTILILDGSGSMWGQIDGKAKITIAQEVIGELLQSLPQDQALGLTVYGHRRKGDCSDIETLVPAGGGTQTAISNAVNAIKPKGKTPMTGAVIAAANSLRFTEEKATVILVSDGIETCHPDPCAAARALEEAGVDFTAHVVGFNISDPEAVAQMQCLASETGGTFRSADDASELGAALVEIAAAPEPEPEPVPVTVTFRATIGKGGPIINEGLIWAFLPEGTGHQTDPIGTTHLTLLPGDYSVAVLRLEDEATTGAAFSVTGQDTTVTFVLPETLHQALLEAVDTAPVGATIDVGWDAVVGEKDYIAVTYPDDKAGSYISYSYISKGNPVSLRLPIEPGAFELRYIRSVQGKISVSATHPIAVTDLVVTITAADEVNAGSALDITWDGPDYEKDYVTIVPADAKDSAYKNYAYTEKGNPVAVVSPIEPGAYEIRYVTQGNVQRVMARRPLAVVAVAAVLSAKDEAAAGGLLDVTWEGPDNKNDYVSIAALDHAPHKYFDYAYTKRGNPASVTMPLDPGVYELRYIANGNPVKVIATRPVTVVTAKVTLDVQSEAVAGSEIDVDWSGPDNKNDYISVAKADANANKYEHYVYTKRGNPGALTMPLEPGTYQIRYIAAGNPEKVLANRDIKIGAAEVSLEASDSATAGSTIEVHWDGPDNKNDYISVATHDEVPSKYLHYSYTKRGNPSKVKMPLEPGTYQLRYIAQGNPQRILADRDITVAAAEVALDAPDTAIVGSDLEVSYVGPNNPNDFISIAEIGSDASEYSHYQNTKRGNPVTLKMPTDPGTYLLRYVAHGSPQKVLARRSVKVVTASAAPATNAILDAAVDAPTGGLVEVFWVGPDAQGDVVTITKIGSDERLSEVATSSGNPVTLNLPDTPGQYILHYFSGPDSRSISRRPLTLK